MRFRTILTPLAASVVPPALAAPSLIFGSDTSIRTPFAQPEMGMDYCRYVVGEDNTEWVIQLPPEWWRRDTYTRGSPGEACTRISHIARDRMQNFRLLKDCYEIRDPNGFSAEPGWLQIYMLSDPWDSPVPFEALLRIVSGWMDYPYQCVPGFFTKPEDMPHDYAERVEYYYEQFGP